MHTTTVNDHTAATIQALLHAPDQAPDCECEPGDQPCRPCLDQITSIHQALADHPVLQDLRAQIATATAGQRTAVATAWAAWFTEHAPAAIDRRHAFRRRAGDLAADRAASAASAIWAAARRIDPGTSWGAAAEETAWALLTADTTDDHDLRCGPWRTVFEREAERRG